MGGSAYSCPACGTWYGVAGRNCLCLYPAIEAPGLTTRAPSPVPEPPRAYECHEGECHYPGLIATVAALKAEVAGLRGLLGDLAPFFGPSPGARYDALAEKFYRATGVMAPGKSVAMEMANSQPPHEVRASRMCEWLEAETAEMALRIDAALGGGS